MRARPRVGISRCLSGEQVRYDGTHRLAEDVIAALAPHVEWVPVCPEVEVGMGTPREPIRLVARADGVPSAEALVRLHGVTSGEDWTGRMHAWARARAAALRALPLSGFVLKARSPSCGIRDVEIHEGPPEGGHYVRSPDVRSVRLPAFAEAPAGKQPVPGRGLFAQALVEAMPDLPMADEDQLRDPRAREAFLERVRAYRKP